jgi:hypothetical protein
MWNKLLFLFVILLACSAQAGYEIIYPESVGTKDEWTNVGGADKIASLIDTVMANYIRAANNSTDDTQEVNMADLTVAENNDVIDSVRVVWCAWEVGAGANISARASIMINTDVLNGTTRALDPDIGDGCTEYVESFTSPPGSRGTWDIVEVDSLVTRLAVTASSAGDHPRVNYLYVEVFFTAEVRYAYYLTDNIDFLCTGDIGDRQLPSFSPTLDTLKIEVTATASDKTFLFTGTGTHPAEWPTGGFSVRFKVIDYAETPQFQIVVRRKSTGCVTEESTVAFPIAGNLTIDSIGNYVVDVSSKDWAAGTAYILVEFQFDNAAGQPTDSVYIEMGGVTSAVLCEVPFSSVVQGTGSGSGSGANWDALCSNIEDTVEGNSFQQVDFDADQGTGGVGAISGAQFESGKNHLFMYDASIGGVAPSIASRLQILFGSTIIGEIAYEPSPAPGLPISARGGGASGFYIASGTAAAADSFFMQHRCNTPGNEVYTGGMCLIAINLGNLTLNTDYWFDQQNGGADHKLDSTTTTQDTLLGLTVDLSGKSGTDNYIVLASCEVWSGALTQDIRVLFAIDGVVQKERVYLEFEDSDDRQSWSYARLTSMTAASHRLTIVYGPADAGTTQKYARRGRIIVIDTSAYDQVIAVSNDDLDTAKVTYSTWENHDANSGTDFDSVGFTPNQSEPIVVIANSWVNMGLSGALTPEVGGLMRLRNDSTGAVWSDASSHSPRATATPDSTRKGMVTALGFKGDSANSTSWTLQVSCDSNYATAVRPRFGYTDMIIWGLTETVTPPASTRTRRPQVIKNVIGAREEDLRAKDIASMLGLPCNCPNDSITVRK